MARGNSLRASEGRGWGRFEGDPRGTAVGTTDRGETIYADDEGNEWTSGGKTLKVYGKSPEYWDNLKYEQNDRYFTAIKRQKAAVEAADSLKAKEYAAGTTGALFKETYDAARKIARTAYDAAEERLKKEWMDSHPAKDGGEAPKYSNTERAGFVSKALKEAGKALAAAYPSTDGKYNPVRSLPNNAEEPAGANAAGTKHDAAGLALAKLTDDKRKFLVVKKYVDYKANLAIGDDDGSGNWNLGFLQRG